MTDREKVIKGLEVCASIAEGESCPKECPYYQDVCYGYDQLMRDALALLKEQQKLIDRLIEENASNAEMAEGCAELLKEQEAVEPFHRCNGKDFSLIEDSHFDYCPYCGKPITWAKQEGR